MARQLLAIFATTFAEASPVPPTPVQPTDEYLRCLMVQGDFHVVVALSNGVVLGGFTAYELKMFGHQASELFIYDVAVASCHRRQGIGSVLFGSARELRASRGLSCLYVGAMANEIEAVRFYQSTGLQREDVAWFTQEL